MGLVTNWENKSYEAITKKGELIWYWLKHVLGGRKASWQLQMLLGNPSADSQCIIILR